MKQFLRSVLFVLLSSFFLLSPPTLFAYEGEYEDRGYGQCDITISWVQPGEEQSVSDTWSINGGWPGTREARLTTILVIEGNCTDPTPEGFAVKCSGDFDGSDEARDAGKYGVTQWTHQCRINDGGSDDFGTGDVRIYVRRGGGAGDYDLWESQWRFLDREQADCEISYSWQPATGDRQSATDRFDRYTDNDSGPGRKTVLLGSTVDVSVNCGISPPEGSYWNWHGGGQSGGWSTPTYSGSFVVSEEDHDYEFRLQHSEGGAENPDSIYWKLPAKAKSEENEERKHGDPFEFCSQIPLGTELYQACTACYNQDGARIFTAVGCIRTDGVGLAQDLITLLLGISGGIALLSLLVGAFYFTTSQGDTSKVKTAKELMTAAVSGLLFIIFSVAILQFIGITILNIPGLGS